MKIVYIINSILPSRSANSIHVMKMCQAFSRQKYEVILLVPDRYKEYEKNVQDVYDYYGVNKCFKIKKIPYIPIRIIGPIYYSLIVQIYIKKIKPDIVYGRDLFGCIFSCWMKNNTIYEAHLPLFQRNLFYKIPTKLLITNKNLKRMIVISETLKKIFLAFESSIGDKILVEHDGSDKVPDFNRMDRWPGRKNIIQVGYFGHLYKGRGMEIIIELARTMPDIDFHIVGGNEKDIEYWKDQVKKNSNIFFHGYIQPNLVYKYRNNCDILLAPYRNAVFLSGNKIDTSNFMSPLKIFEYMSSNKAIISSDLPVIREVLNDNNSILVPCDNIDEWIKAINKLKDIKLRKKLSQNSYNDFLQKYTWGKRAEDILNFIH